MNQPLSARRVHRLTRAEWDYVGRNNSKKKRRRGPCQVHRRLCPSIASKLLRGRNTLSIPARVQSETPTHRHLSEGVTHPETNRDLPMLLASAASNPAVSDRAHRVYVVAAVLDQEVTAAQVAAYLPSLTEGQAGRLLGDLVSAGLLRKRLRVIGYKDGRRVRRGAYSLAGGAL